MMKEVIPDYNPSKELLGRALESAAGGKLSAVSDQRSAIGKAAGISGFDGG